MTIEEKDEIEDRSMFVPGGRVGVLLIHGLGGTPVELRFIAQGLARAGYTVYCCQLAGHNQIHLCRAGARSASFFALHRICEW